MSLDGNCSPALWLLDASLAPKDRIAFPPHRPAGSQDASRRSCVKVSGSCRRIEPFLHAVEASVLGAVAGRSLQSDAGFEFSGGSEAHPTKNAAGAAAVAASAARPFGNGDRPRVVRTTLTGTVLHAIKVRMAGGDCSDQTLQAGWRPTTGPTHAVALFSSHDRRSGAG